ncbi:MAG: [Fe-S]-binding protein, partial [Thermoleophilia bacterium]|nr:[Fe-S]-binding protein [Thermoleophilia bacterium]
MSPLTDGDSYWLESTSETRFPQLRENIDVDVCVVGGGITGLLTAWELSEAGLSVAIVESKRIAASVTGYTTAKLSSQHGLRYKRLTDEHGPDVARVYGQVNEAALRRVRDIAQELDVSAEIEARDSYVYATRPESLPGLHAEARAARDAGLPAAFVHDVPLPFATVGAVRFTGQAQIHPRRLLLPLATELTKRGVRLYEQTKAEDVAYDDGWTVTCDGGTVRARNAVVVATLLPSAGVAEHLR